MSIPSSSDEVATRHGIAPAFRSSSICVALLARERAVVRPRDLLLGELVQPQREALGEAAVVDEDDRRAVRPDQLDELPGRSRARSSAARSPLLVGGDPARLAHVLDRDDDLEVELLRDAGVDELDRRVRPRRSGRSPRAAAASPRGRSAGRLRRERARAARPRARDGRRASSRRPRAPRRGSACRRSRSSSRAREVSSRKSDSGVVIRMSGGVAEHRRALLLRRVARADGDAQLRLEAGERAAQVPLDVVVERLERRDVEQAEAVSRRRRQAGRWPRGTPRASSPSRSAPG